MPDTQADILALRARITAAQRARIRAEHERDAADAAANAARDKLRDEFGVTTAAEAKALHAQLTDELRAATDDLKAKLDQAGV